MKKGWLRRGWGALYFDNFLPSLCFPRCVTQMLEQEAGGLPSHILGSRKKWLMLLNPTRNCGKNALRCLKRSWVVVFQKRWTTWGRMRRRTWATFCISKVPCPVPQSKQILLLLFKLNLGIFLCKGRHPNFPLLPCVPNPPPPRLSSPFSPQILVLCWDRYSDNSWKVLLLGDIIK